MQNKLLEAALKYCSMGYAVIPLKGKVPAIASWEEFRVKTPDEEQIKSWFDVNGDKITGIAILLGFVENLVVLDIDKEEENIEKLDIPETVSAKSGDSGRHFYFKIPDGFEIRTINLRSHGIAGELRAELSYIVAPPSIHPETGNSYEWIIPLEYEKLAELPKWLIDISKENSNWVSKDWPEIMSGAKEGERHNKSVSVAGKLLNALKKSEWDNVAYPLLSAWNDKFNEPPLEEKEVSSIFSSLAKKESAKRGSESLETEEPAYLKSRPLSAAEILNMPDELMPKFLVEHFIPENGITSISGHPGCGKSWVVLHIAQCVASGGKFIGAYDTIQKNVLVVDGESGVAEMKRRLKMLGYSEDLPIHFYCQTGFKLDHEKDVKKLLSVVAELEIGLVVLDPFVSMHSGVENNAEEIQRVMEAMQQFNQAGATVVFIHHHRKSESSEPGMNLRGSSAILGRLDSAMTISKSEETPNTILLEMNHVKSRRGKSLGEFSVLITENKEDNSITLSYENEIVTPSKRGQAKEIIENLLAEKGEMFIEQIVKEVRMEADIGKRNAYQALRELESEGKVKAEREGKKKKYSLTIAPPDALEDAPTVDTPESGESEKVVNT